MLASPTDSRHRASLGQANGLVRLYERRVLVQAPGDLESSAAEASPTLSGGSQGGDHRTEKGRSAGGCRGGGNQDWIGGIAGLSDAMPNDVRATFAQTSTASVPMRGHLQRAHFFLPERIANEEC